MLEAVYSYSDHYYYNNYFYVDDQFRGGMDMGYGNPYVDLMMGRGFGDPLVDPIPIVDDGLDVAWAFETRNVSCYSL